MLSKGKWEIASVDWRAYDVPATPVILRDQFKLIWGRGPLMFEHRKLNEIDLMH